MRYERVVIAGLGKSGKASAEYCIKHMGTNGTDGFSVGSLTIYGGESNEKSIEAAKAYEAAGATVIFDTQHVEGEYDLAIVSPGIPAISEMYISTKAAARELISEPEFAWRQSPDRWIGITGTNGKTTTTSLTADLLTGAGIQAQTCGNIGLPCIEAEQDRSAGDYLVAELSSFQLESMPSFAPDAAILLNITPDHIEWHGDLDAYAAAKLHIFANQTQDQFAIVDATAPNTRKIAQDLTNSGHSVIVLGGVDGFGSTWNPEGRSGCKHSGNAWVEPGGRLVVQIDGHDHRLALEQEMNIKGAHNVQNALAASSAALIAGADDESIARGLREYIAMEHRVEACGQKDGILFYNDSKATNTDAAAKALTAFPNQPVIILLGGHDKGTDLSDLVSDCMASCKAAICYGEAAQRFHDAFEEAMSVSKGDLQLMQVGKMADALDAALEIAEPGDVVLLSPACSSFDEFGSYGERGKVFKELVARVVESGEEN